MRAALITLLTMLLWPAVLAQRPHPYFYSSHQGQYRYFPTPYPAVSGPRIVQIGHNYGGFGYSGTRYGYGSGYRSYYGHHRYGPGYDYYHGYRRQPYRPYSYGRHYDLRPRVYRFYISSPTGGAIVRANYSDIVIDVKPARALVFIDSKLVGNGNDFSTERSGYPLLEGEYQLRVEHPGYEPFEAHLQVAPNHTIHLNLELKAQTSGP